MKVSIQVTQVNSALSKASYAPYNDSAVHEHNHRYTPHLHSVECERYLSGVDKNRQARFYFTKGQTPCRVYLSYNDKLLSSSADVIPDKDKEKLSQVNTALNGRKLSAKTLRTQLKLSPQFIDDAKNYIFVKESMSLIPQLPQIPQITTNAPLTMAEMAVLPLNLPSINMSNVSSTKHKPHLAVGKHTTSTITPKMTSSSSNSLSTTNKSFNL